MVKAGFVRHIGLSEADTKTIQRANNVHPITDLQADGSPGQRKIKRMLSLFKTLSTLKITNYR
jgi:aryl-alcohol dehydrogenase-like predicted oxidoreductase